jgi:hypothetical protein
VFRGFFLFNNLSFIEMNFQQKSSLLPLELIDCVAKFISNEFLMHFGIGCFPPYLQSPQLLHKIKINFKQRIALCIKIEDCLRNASIFFGRIGANYEPKSGWKLEVFSPKRIAFVAEINKATTYLECVINHQINVEFITATLEKSYHSAIYSKYIGEELLKLCRPKQSDMDQAVIEIRKDEESKRNEIFVDGARGHNWTLIQDKLGYAGFFILKLLITKTIFRVYLHPKIREFYLQILSS